MACRHESDGVRTNVSAGRPDAGDATAVAAEKPGDLAVLHDVDAPPVGRVREPPGHVVVPGDPTAALERRAEHGIPNVR